MTEKYSSQARPTVALARCTTYSREHIAAKIDELAAACTPAWNGKNLHGRHILLKANLVSGNGLNVPLATSAPEFIAAAALWCKEAGAKVKIGDSPAFGSAAGVCRRNGITAAVADLDIPIIEFATPVPATLPCGAAITLAGEVLESDILLNLPRIKAHNQMYVTLAVKNLFGCIKGTDKAWLHMKEGGGKAGHSRFAQIIVELHNLLAEKVTLFHIIDGITAMHEAGPMNGTAIDLGILAASQSAVALDTAVLEMLALEKSCSPLWSETARQGLAGWDSREICYPFLSPQDFSLPEFIAPDILAPVRFNPFHYLKSSLRRLFSGKK